MSTNRKHLEKYETFITGTLKGEKSDFEELITRLDNSLGFALDEELTVDSLAIIGQKISQLSTDIHRRTIETFWTHSKIKID